MIIFNCVGFNTLDTVNPYFQDIKIIFYDNLFSELGHKFKLSVNHSRYDILLKKKNENI